MRKVVLIIIGLFAAISLWAVKAYPFPVDVKQSDGTTLRVILHGDEEFHYYTTVDDVLIVKQNDAYYVGAVDAAGRLTATTQLAHNAADRSPQERLLAKSQQMDAFLEAGRAERMARSVRSESLDFSNNTLLPHKGAPKVVVLLVEFSDTLFSIDNPRRSFEEYFNSMSSLANYGNGEHQNSSSIKKYWSAFRPQNLTKI